jgi:hypothetical protein
MMFIKRIERSRQGRYVWQGHSIKMSSDQASDGYPLTTAGTAEGREMRWSGNGAGERMQNNGQRMFGHSGGMLGQGRKEKTHLLPLSMSNEARQPNAVAEIMQFDRDPGIHRHRRNLPDWKFGEHAMNTEIEEATLTHGALPTTNGNRKHMREFN